ncbi:branched-chain amino acid ABC transporter permease, partial [Thermodesulfobacteriota bacterium]
MTIYSQIGQFIISGLSLGCVYGIIGLSYVLVFNSTGVLNFAQGEYAMLGGLLAISLYHVLHFPLVLAVLVSVMVISLIGLLQERLAMRPIPKDALMPLIITSIALSLALRGIGMLVWGKDPHALPAFSGQAPITWMNMSIDSQSFWIMGISLLIGICLYLFFDRTLVGKAMKGCAENPLAASLVGIKVKQMVVYSYAGSALLGAMGGIIVTPITLMKYDTSLALGLKGFVAFVIGGMGGAFGSFLGGIFLGRGPIKGHR